MAATVDLIARLKTEGAGGFKSDMGGVGGAVSGAASRINSSFQTIVKVGAAAFAALGVASIAAGAQLISLGSEAEEMQGKFDVVFATFGGQVSDNLDKFAGEVGRSKFELRGFASILGDTLKPMGFTEESAAGLSEELVKLAVDLGSFNNMETDQALQRLQSTLIGNHGNALAFGVIINENTLSAELLRMGVEDLTGAELEQAKVQARINLLMAGTTDAQGDAARTSESWANQQRRLNSILSDAGTEMGLKLLPVVTPLLALLGDMATGAVPWLSQAFETVLAPLERVSFSFQTFFTNVSYGQAPLEAFQNLLRSLGFAQLANDLIPFLAQIDALKEQFLTAIQPIVDFMAEHVKLQDILVVLGIAVATVVIPALLGLVGTFLAFIAPILAVLAVVSLLRQAWEADFGGIQGKTAEAWAVLRGVFAQISAWVTGTLIPRLQELYAQWVTVVWPSIVSGTQSAWATISAIFSALVAWVTGTLIPTVIQFAAEWYARFDTIMTVVTNLQTAFGIFTAEIGRWINDNLGPWANYLAERFNAVMTAFKSDVADMWAIVEPVFTIVYNWLKSKLDEALSAIGAKWADIMTGFGSDVDRAKGRVQPFIDAITNFWDWISGKVFNFEISIPNLPSWAVPGSPLPIHTAWENFADDMNSMDIAPSMSLDGFSRMASPQMAFTNDTSGAMGFGGGGFGGGMTINVYIDGGSADMQNSARTGVGAALKEAGLSADIRRRI